MTQTDDLTRPIIEALYSDALVLADDVRAVFALGTKEPVSGESARTRLALSTEGLKTTTRMMHLLAWLLNQRAYFSGELSESQVRNHGALPLDRPADPEQLAMLEPETRELIEETEAMHRRIARLDSVWRQGLERQSPARAILDRVDRAFSKV